MRRLADEQIVQRDVGQDQYEANDRRWIVIEPDREALSDKSHEAELVQLTAQREEHREPDVDSEHISLALDVVERQHAARQQCRQAEERNRRGIEAEGRG